jgi:hypothetical protein
MTPERTARVVRVADDHHRKCDMPVTRTARSIIDTITAIRARYVGAERRTRLGNTMGGGD